MMNSDTKKMAIIGVWLEVESQHFEKPASMGARDKANVWNSYRSSLGGRERSQVGKCSCFYEKRLSESKYLAGECFTLVDLHHLPNIHYLMKSKSKELFESRPHVSAWVADITARPAWSKVIAMLNK